MVSNCYSLCLTDHYISDPVHLDAQSVLKKAEETPLELEGNVLTVSSALEPTHDQSILLVKNLNPKTSKETLKNFVESTKNADVLKVVFGEDGTAIVILNNEIGRCTLRVFARLP